VTTQSDAALPARHALGVAALLGVIHAVVDASCVALLIQGSSLGSVPGAGEALVWLPDVSLWDLYILYNALAFGTQFSIGAVADRWGAYRPTALVALGLLAGGVAIGPVVPLVAVVLAGLGNAAFHVGAGALVLRLSPDRAGPSGVFVAPGAIGLAVGAWCGLSLECWPWISLGLLAAGAGVLWKMDDAGLPWKTSRAGPTGLAPRPRPVAIGSRLVLVCVLALLVSIVIRSTGGLLVGAAHRGQVHVLWGLAIAAFAGKAIGGLVSDGLGWIKTSLIALVLSAPLLSLLAQDAPAAVAGMLLFQMTMPVTLLAVYRALPDEPGLAFGLTTLALLVGAVPVFVLPTQWLTGPLWLLGLIGASVVALLVGLPPILRSAGRAGC